MVLLSDIQSSNSRIASALPPGLVAVFVGATSGIGETTLKQFVKHARQPRVYFVGRSQEAGDRISKECKLLNPEGECIFVKADVSLIRNVDNVCRDIKSKENVVNLLFLTTGTMISHTETEEGLHFAAALITYCRTRFIVNLLPLLQQAAALRRVVTVFTGGKEGPVDAKDMQAWKVPMLSQRGHMSSLVTLSLEALAKKAPDVTFIHNFPGPVKSNLARGARSPAILILRAVFAVIGPMIYIPNQECGERHLFLATSAKYPAGTGSDETAGVLLEGDIEVIKGTDGGIGSGVYSVNFDGESSGPKVEELLVKLRKDGMVEKVWGDTEEEFKRITGSEAI